MADREGARAAIGIGIGLALAKSILAELAEAAGGVNDTVVPFCTICADTSPNDKHCTAAQSNSPPNIFDMSNSLLNNTTHNYNLLNQITHWSGQRQYNHAQRRTTGFQKRHLVPVRATVRATSSLHRVIVHIGIHKTGTTSIQSFLHANRQSLRRFDIDFYSGRHIPDNHVELHAAAMRSDRLSPFKTDSGLVFDHSYRSMIRDHVRAYVSQSDCRQLLFSAEGLSYLRYPDEMEYLRSLFHGADIEIVVYLRNPLEFLSSYRREMLRHKLPNVVDCDSFAYTAPDSWLIDFEQRIAPFRTAFGADHVTVIDYDAELLSAGNIIPSFLRILGIEHAFDRNAWDGIFMNQRAS